MKMLRNGVALVCLTMLLIGCAATKPPATQTKVVHDKPPAALYPECAEPVVSFDTDEDLAEAFYAMRQALTECRAGVQALKSWSDAQGEDS